MADQLAWLMDWYAAQCDGEWEHRYGVTIGTLDNPGWTLEIDLAGTSLETRDFEPVAHNISPEEAIHGPSGNKNWWTCEVEESVFKAFGGPRDLEAMIGLFREWLERSGT